MLKLLLVDDEATVLQGLSHILTQYCPNYEIVGAALNAADALRLLPNVHADVVITDVKMPDMDGVELTKQIRTLYPETSVVVHSGYADFEFVRQTMKLGACDYLLKPCHYQNILDILHKIEEKRASEGERSQLQAHQELLKEALSGKRTLEPDWCGSRPLRMAALSLQGSGGNRAEQLLAEQWKRGALLQDMAEMVQVDRYIVMLFPAEGGESAWMQKLRDVQQFLLKQGYGAFVGIGDEFSDPEELRQAYSACIKRLDFAQFNELPMIVNESSYRAYFEKQRARQFGDYFNGASIANLLLKGDAAKLKQQVEAAVHELTRLHVYWDPKRLKNDVLKELLHVEEQLRGHGICPVQGELIDYVDEVKKMATFRDLMLWVKRITATLTAETETQEALPSYIQAAIQYMEQHYMEDITLKAVSDTVFLNPWYFSSQFKKHMNVTFSEYVNQVRVRIAKQFLKQKDLKVYQVAEMVGFQDAAYFSTVFKSMEHISPKDYQKTVS